MGVSESIGGFYSAIEEKFYGAMDFLSDKGVPVYAVIDPLEEKGIPAFPVAIASLLLVLLLVYGLLFLPGQELTMKLSIKDNNGGSITGVNIGFFADAGKEIEDGSTGFRDGQ